MLSRTDDRVWKVYRTCWFLFRPEIEPDDIVIQKYIREQSLHHEPCFNHPLTYASLYTMYVDYAVHKLIELFRVFQPPDRPRKELDEDEIKQSAADRHNELAYRLMQMIDSYLPMMAEMMQTSLYSNPQYQAVSKDISGHLSSNATEAELLQAAEEAIFKRYDRQWWDRHHDSNCITQSLPCEDDMDRTPIGHIWRRRDVLFGAYKTMSTAEMGHDPLTTLLCKAMPQKHTYRDFVNTMKEVFDTKQRRKIQQKMPCEIIATGLSVLLYTLEWWFVFLIGMYRHSSHDLTVNWDWRIHCIQQWNDLHNPSIATTEWLMSTSNALTSDPPRALYCIKEFIKYGVSCTPAFRDALRECSIWDAYEYQLVQVLNRYRSGIYKAPQLETYLSCMCIVGFHIRQPNEFWRHVLEHLREEPNNTTIFVWEKDTSLHGRRRYTKGLFQNHGDKTNEEEEDEDEVEENENEEKKPKPLTSSLPSSSSSSTSTTTKTTTTVPKRKSKLKQPFRDESDQGYFIPPSLSSSSCGGMDNKHNNNELPRHLIRHKDQIRIPLSVFREYVRELFDNQHRISAFTPIHPDETTSLLPIQMHSYRGYLICRRIVDTVMTFFYGSEQGTSLCLNAVHAYFRKRCGTSNLKHLMDTLIQHHPYEYALFYHLIKTWEEWNSVWSAPVCSLSAYHQSLSIQRRFRDKKPHPRSDWIMYCPNCHDIQSLIVQSQGSGSSYPDQYSSDTVSGFRNVLVCLETNRYLCNRKNGQSAKRCADTALRHMPTFGQICMINGETYRRCDQHGCANIMQVNSDEDFYNHCGIQCANCVKRSHLDEINRIRVWQRNEMKQQQRDHKYVARPFPNLHWTILRHSYKYETKPKRGRPSRKNPSSLLGLDDCFSSSSSSSSSSAASADTSELDNLLELRSEFGMMELGPHNNNNSDDLEDMFENELRRTYAEERSEAGEEKEKERENEKEEENEKEKEMTGDELKAGFEDALLVEQEINRSAQMNDLERVLSRHTQLLQEEESAKHKLKSGKTRGRPKSDKRKNDAIYPSVSSSAASAAPTGSNISSL